MITNLVGHEIIMFLSLLGCLKSHYRYEIQDTSRKCMLLKHANVANVLQRGVRIHPFMSHKMNNDN